MQPPKEMNFSSAGFDSTLLHTRSVESSSGGGGGGNGGGASGCGGKVMRVN